VIKPLVIGIAGGTGSGKSTVARRVADALRRSSVAFVDMDAYYRNFAHLPLADRRRVNWDHPDAFDLDLFADHLARLARGEAVDKPVYDFVEHVRAPHTVRVEPADVIVIDGILLFVDERVREVCDVKVYVDADADVRLVRRLKRDMAHRGRPLDEILEQYLATVRRCTCSSSSRASATRRDRAARRTQRRGHRDDRRQDPASPRRPTRSGPARAGLARYSPARAGPA
jgi:uridine kinase